MASGAEQGSGRVARPTLAEIRELHEEIATLRDELYTEIETLTRRVDTVHREALRALVKRTAKKERA